MSSPGEQISIVTVTHDSAAHIDKWLDSASRWLPDAQLIVVDNASADDTEVIARRHPSCPEVISSGGNLGFARGCNLGASHAARPFVWFLNPDARVEGCDFESLEVALSSLPFGLAETAMIDEGGHEHFESFEHRSTRGEYAAHVLTPLWPRVLGPNPWGVRHGSGWLSGASLLVRGDEFQRLGGFDQSFFLLYEDRELSIRARKAGLPLRTLSALRVSHEIGTGSAAQNLDVRRRAWALLSWIEYLCATSSAELGAREAGRILHALEFEAALGRVLSAGRLGAKLRSAGEVVRFVRDTVAAQAAPDFYYRAAEALHRRENE